MTHVRTGLGKAAEAPLAAIEAVPLLFRMPKVLHFMRYRPHLIIFNPEKMAAPARAARGMDKID